MPAIGRPLLYGRQEEDIVILVVGHMYETAVQVREILKEKGYSCSLVNVRFVKPLDQELLQKLAKTHKLVATIEENVRSGGYGEHVASYYAGEDIRVRLLTFAIPDEFVEHGDVSVLREKEGLDADSMAERIGKVYSELE